MFKRVIRLVLITVIFLCIGAGNVFANGTKTQVFIANKIIQELEKNNGFIEIEGMGKMEVEPSIKEAILNHKEAFRAGAVGPDFYPSFLMGLRGVHANESGRYLEELIKNYRENPPSDKNKRREIEAFLLGMQVHYAGDVVSRREFNALAGGDFPRIAYDMGTGEANVLLRYTAIEGYYDSILPDMGYSYKIAAPIDFVADNMAFNGMYGGDTRSGLNYKYYYENSSDTKVGMEIPAVLFVKYHQQIVNLNNTLNQNAATGIITNVGQFHRWIGGIKGSIKDWIRANEEAATRVLNGEPTAAALTKEYKGFVDGPLENMIPGRDILKVLKYGSGIGALDEIFGVSDAITGEVTDIILDKLTGGLEAPTNKDLAELLIGDKDLFSDSKEQTKAKIKAAGDKSLQEAFNLSKLLLIKKSELEKILLSTKSIDNSQWLSMDMMEAWDLKETITGVKLQIKTGTVEFSGTDSDIDAYVQFKDGTSKTIRLDKPGYNDFEYGDDDEYFLDFEKRISLSEIDKITIGIANHLDDWYLERVIIKTPMGRELSRSYPKQELNSTSRRRTVFPDVSPRYITVRVKTKENAGWFSRGSSTNGTDGDVYVRVDYSGKSFHYILDKSFYNDFESNDDDRYDVPVELSYGYNYSHIRNIVLYKANGDDWKPQEAWIYVGNSEKRHTWIDNWVDNNGVSIGGAIRGHDVDVKGMARYKDVDYGKLHIIPNFFRGIYSLDKKNNIEKINGSNEASEGEGTEYDFTEDVSIRSVDGKYLQSKEDGGSVIGLLENLTHGNALFNDVYFKDGIIEATIRVLPAKDGYQGNGGFTFRVSDMERGPNNHKGYYVGIEASGDGQSGTVMLGRNNKGNYTHIEGKSMKLAIGQNYKLKVLAYGSTINVYLDGKKLFTAKDSHYSEGQVGPSGWRSTTLYEDFLVKNK